MYGKSVISIVNALIPAKTNEPRIIPKIPAIIVKKTDSNIICTRTSPGVAPRALLTPSSLVLSLTEISNILPIPITLL